MATFPSNQDPGSRIPSQSPDPGQIKPLVPHTHATHKPPPSSTSTMQSPASERERFPDHYVVAASVGRARRRADGPSRGSRASQGRVVGEFEGGGADNLHVAAARRVARRPCDGCATAADPTDIALFARVGPASRAAVMASSLPRAGTEGAAVLLVVFALFAMQVARERALETFNVAQAATTDSPCTHFKSDWFEVISLPKMRHGMSSPKIVSVGSTVVQSGEILELPGCPGKRIQRERHMTVSVKYQPLETWPFGRSRNIALDGAQAVCVQHAIDQFKGNITCDST